MQANSSSRSLSARRVCWFASAVLCAHLGCSAEATPPSLNTGGTIASSGGSPTGGISATGGLSTGGIPPATGGNVSTTGGTTGGTPPSTGGLPSTGGASSTTGGTSTGGTTGGFATSGSGGAGAPAQGGSAGKTAGGGPNAGAGGKSGGTGGTSGAGGSAGGSSGGAAGGGTGFDPCPPSTQPCKILPLGDSITDGIGFAGGYRVELFHKAHADGKNVTFVGGSMNGPATVDGVTFPKSHEGHSGWTISQIDGIVPSPALNPDPQIILLHIGTNDMVQGASGAPDRLKTLIGQIIDDQPNSLLVVSNIIPLSSGGSAVNTFNAAVPGVVKSFADMGKHILFVDQFKGFPTSELGDGVHPNQAGYARMAGVWYEAIKGYLH